MIDYYAELKLSPDSSLEGIRDELLRKEQVWTRREVNSPDVARAKLTLINEAKRVFSSESSRAKYDLELENSRKKPVSSDPKQERYALWKKWYEQALSYMKSEQWDLAKASIEKALCYIDTEREDPYFYSDCAYIYLRCHRYSVAMEYINNHGDQCQGRNGGNFHMNDLTPTAKQPRITTVCIDRCDADYTPWVSSFSTRERACEFKRKVEEKLEVYGVADIFLVTIDSGELNDEQYLEWIDAEFREEDPEDDEENS